MFEVIEDTLIDGVKLVPFLFITYLFMEILEHKMNNNLKEKIAKAGKDRSRMGRHFRCDTTVRIFNSGGESLFGRYHNSRNAYCRIYVNL